MREKRIQAFVNLGKGSVSTIDLPRGWKRVYEGQVHSGDRVLDVKKLRSLQGVIFDPVDSSYAFTNVEDYACIIREITT